MGKHTNHDSKRTRRHQKDRTFVFLEPALNRRLIGLLRKAKIHHIVDPDGMIHYSIKDAPRVENELICAVRRSKFTKWLVQTCPPDWVDTYREYMKTHEIPYCEEIDDGTLWFLLPGRHRPSRWKMADPNTVQVSP
jgi:hypothetical protein